MFLEIERAGRHSSDKNLCLELRLSLWQRELQLFCTNDRVGGSVTNRELYFLAEDTHGSEARRSWTWTWLVRLPPGSPLHCVSWRYHREAGRSRSLTCSTPHALQPMCDRSLQSSIQRLNLNACTCTRHKGLKEHAQNVCLPESLLSGLADLSLAVRLPMVGSRMRIGDAVCVVPHSALSPRLPPLLLSCKTRFKTNQAETKHLEKNSEPKLQIHCVSPSSHLTNNNPRRMSGVALCFNQTEF